MRDEIRGKVFQLFVRRAHELINAKVRWRRGDTYGLVFEDTFQFGDMARIVAGLQLGGIPQFGA